MSKETECVHSGSIMDTITCGLNTPIHTSSSFAYLETAENVYPRYFNTPNQLALVEKLCALENGEAGLIFSSGMAAISSVLFALLSSGDHAVLQRDIYGGTHHYVTADFNRFGIQHTFVDNLPEAIDAAIRSNTKLIYIETPSNPLLLITDIAAVADIAQRNGIITVIDNTFATPINQNPIDLGMDIVIHSGTKYLGGHSDICCGVCIGREDLITSVKSTAANFGGSLNAMTCYLLERSLKTLALRVAKQNRNAQSIAKNLQSHPGIKRVFYPGLPDHPDHAIAASQMIGFGGMLSFELKADGAGPQQFLKRLKLITPALSLGGVESIICAPAATSHAKLTPQERAELGIADGLLRFSVGIENPDDILDDIFQALG